MPRPRSAASIAETYDFDHRTSRLPLVIGFVLILTMTMMIWTFRNLTLALLTTALNLLSVGAAFGVLTLVFQHDWFNGILELHVIGHRRRLDPAVLLRGADRPVDGLPRLRHDADP